MGWLESLAYGMGTVVDGVVWTLEEASLKKIITGIAKYTLNTSFQILNQVGTIHTAIPALITNERSKIIAFSMVDMVVYDILPVVGVNYANNRLQSYFRGGEDTESNWAMPYAVFLSTLTLADYAVKAYTLRQGVQSFIRITVLDSVAPAAFNSSKGHKAVKGCSDKECTTQRKMKGWIREPIILLTNDILTGGISYIPYVGMPISKVVRIFFNGRYITRLATPELCEQHKFLLMMQESVLALGLTYELTSMLMEKVLLDNVGLPPYLTYRTMKHLLLLLHANLAAHMILPLVQPKDATLPVDPLNVYEACCRFVSNVVFSGLKDRIPKDLKPDDKNAKPLISFSTAMQFGTKLLNGDMEQEIVPELTKLERYKNQARVILLPPIMHGAHSFINDFIVSRFWSSLHGGMLFTINIIIKIETDKRTQILAEAPKTPVEVAVYYLMGIPAGVTEVVLMLSKEEDFLEFIHALQNWFVRHHVKGEVKLLDYMTTALNGDKRLEAQPSLKDTPPLLSAELLWPDEKETPSVTPVEELLREKDDKVTSADNLVPTQPISKVLDAAGLFGTRARRRAKSEGSGLNPQQIVGASGDNQLQMMGKYS